jgi:hypothetical protein
MYRLIAQTLSQTELKQHNKRIKMELSSHSSNTDHHERTNSSNLVFSSIAKGEVFGANATIIFHPVFPPNGDIFITSYYLFGRHLIFNKI